PSTPDTGGLAAAIVFAGNGYALVAPDYPGLGVSEGRHPYYITDSIIPSITAIIDAVRPFSGVGDAPVFLTGFSQGGWAAMQTLHALEARGDRVLAAAPVAGAFDLRNLSLPVAMKGDAASHSLYLAYAAWGQSAYLGHELESVLTPDMADTVDRLFSGASPQEIQKGLPDKPRDMFNARFLDAFDTGGTHWMLDAFAEASVADFRPRAPVRLYYGAEDKDVSPEESRRLAQRLQQLGADAAAIDVGPVGHDPSMLKAAPLILEWLKELEDAA
ncbi:alpha/beta fold hydrolase, partial [Phenylobacterium sp.]|uniref:alpha/beta hydrolase family protein n=1 Tax=Phenylobacterium sp. TaxID=1871053 RepID=UPI00301DDB1F